MNWKPVVFIVGLVAVSLAVGGYGYAALTSSGNVYTGCLYGGEIRNIKIGTTPKSKCVKGTTQVSWNEQGQDGTDGTSVTSAALAPGDTNCPYGGTSFTSTSGTTYACSGASAVTPLASGQSESGLFSAAGGYADWINATITYPQPLAAAIPDNHVVDVVGGGSATHCPGPGQADAGYLCLYTKGDSSNIYTYSPIVYSDDSLNAMGNLGIFLFWNIGGAQGFIFGSWTVTAP